MFVARSWSSFRPLSLSVCGNLARPLAASEPAFAFDPRAWPPYRSSIREEPMNRRTLALACLFAAGLVCPAAAQEYPTQTIKIISSFGAGGGSDIIARILAARMQEKLGQNVIV